MKRGKKVLCSILCLALAWALAVPAMAAGTVNIVWLEEDVIPGSMENLKKDLGYPEEAAQKGDLISVMRVDQKTGERWAGYVNEKGELIVPFTEYKGHANISPHFFYSEGLLPVVTWASTGIPEKCEYVDKKGKTVLTLEAGILGRPFVEERAAACKFDEFGNAKWGFIDRSGKAVTLYKYDAVKPFSGGVARVQESGRWGYIDLEGQSVPAPPDSDEALMDKAEQALWGSGYRSDDYRILSVSEGMVSVELVRGYYDSAAGEYKSARCYVNENGELIAAPQEVWDEETGEVSYQSVYHVVGKFSEGLAAAGTWVDDGYNFAYGYMDKTGALVIPMDFRVGGHLVFPSELEFVDGMARVSKLADDGFPRYGWINTAGETVIPIEYTDMSDFSEGLAAAKKDGKWGFIDTAGQVVIPFEYERVESRFTAGLAAVEKDGKYGYINAEGETVIPFEYYGVGYSLILDGYIGIVCQRADEKNTARYGIFVNPQSPLAKAESPLAALPFGGAGTGDDGAPAPFPVLPVAAAAAAAVVVVGVFLVLKKKRR